MENSNPPRKTMKRFEIGGHARNLNFACFHNMPLLRSQRSCEWVVDRLVHAAHKHNIAIWAWCIMPTHLHLLVLPRGTRTVRPNMSRFLFSLKQPVAKRAIAWTRRHAPEFLLRLIEVGKDGVPRPHFWQSGGGYDRNLWSADVIWNAIDYIHMNPVEAGLWQAINRLEMVQCGVVRGRQIQPGSTRSQLPPPRSSAAVIPCGTPLALHRRVQ